MLKGKAYDQSNSGVHWGGHLERAKDNAMWIRLETPVRCYLRMIWPRIPADSEALLLVLRDGLVEAEPECIQGGH
jgi:hypothetical protein